MDEEWKDIIGYEGKYMISNLGRIKCVARIQKWGNGFRHVKECILTPRKKGKNNPYLTIILYDSNGNDKTFHVHRLVALHFVGGYFDGADVNHKDGNKSNNICDNLEWCTRSENILHSRNVLGNKFGWVKGQPGPNPKKIVQLTKNGVFIREWPSISEAGREMGCLEKRIRDCVNDVHHWRMSLGYKWVDADCYYSTHDKTIFSGTTNRKYIGKIIEQYTLGGKLIRSFSSASEASRLTGCRLNRITKCAREGFGSSGGYMWRYRSEQPNLTKEKFRNSKYQIK